MATSTEQPGLFKGIQTTILYVGGALVAYIIYKKWKQKQDLAQAGQVADQANAELQQLQQQGVHPSYGDSQFFALVDQLVVAMNGCGTDETAIYNVFKMLKNEADIRKLITTFGVQYYEPCGWLSPISYAEWQVNPKAFGGNISTWLNYELGSSEIDKVNSILTQNGINYAF